MVGVPSDGRSAKPSRQGGILCYYQWLSRRGALHKKNVKMAGIIEKEFPWVKKPEFS
jgi:hypothetical protein